MQEGRIRHGAFLCRYGEKMKMHHSEILMMRVEDILGCLLVGWPCAALAKDSAF